MLQYIFDYKNNNYYKLEGNGNFLYDDDLRKFHQWIGPMMIIHNKSNQMF